MPASGSSWDYGMDCCGVITLPCDAETARSQLLFPGTVTLKGDRLMELTFQLYLPIMHIWRGHIHCVCVGVYEGVRMNVSYGVRWAGVQQNVCQPVACLSGTACVHTIQYLCMCALVWVCVLRETCIFVWAVNASGIVLHYPHDHEMRSERKGTVETWECVTLDLWAISWWVNTVALLHCGREADLLNQVAHCSKSAVLSMQAELFSNNTVFFEKVNKKWKKIAEFFKKKFWLLQK